MKLTEIKNYFELSSPEIVKKIAYTENRKKQLIRAAEIWAMCKLPFVDRAHLKKPLNLLQETFLGILSSFLLEDPIFFDYLNLLKGFYVAPIEAEKTKPEIIENKIYWIPVELGYPEYNTPIMVVYKKKIRYGSDEYKEDIAFSRLCRDDEFIGLDEDDDQAWIDKGKMLYWSYAMINTDIKSPKAINLEKYNAKIVSY